jgi:hypothetical protein
MDSVMEEEGKKRERREGQDFEKKREVEPEFETRSQGLGPSFKLS